MSRQMGQAQTVAFNAGAAEAGKRIAELEGRVKWLRALLTIANSAVETSRVDREKAEAEVKRLTVELDDPYILELESEVERLRLIEDAHVSCEGWPRERTLRAEAEVERLRAKLQRVRDAIKFVANSDGGLVAEIDDSLTRTPIARAALRGGEK